MAKMNFRENVVNTLLEQMEAGTAPWQKPWEPGQVRQPSFNPATGKAYRGMNQVWLEAQGYADPRWVTYRQAQANGYQVRKGEKGTQIEYWQWSERRPMMNDQQQPMLDGNGKQRYQEMRLDRPKVFHAVVFNGSQIDGLEPYVGHEPEFNPVERAEQVLSNLNVPIAHNQRDRAFYHPGEDKIHMPPKGLFKGQYEYYATALHEGGHSTGHPSRLSRDGGPFGSEDYAREELRAEIASYMMTTELGLGHYPERHAPYVKSWMSAIREDRNALFQATRDAEVIRTWVMEPEKRLELTPGKDKKQEVAQEQSMSAGQTFDGPVARKRHKIVHEMFEKYPDAHPTLLAMRCQDSLFLTGSRDDNELLPVDLFKERLHATDLSTDHLERFLGQAAEMSTWGSQALDNPMVAATEHRETYLRFNRLSERFNKIDWLSDIAASPERKAQGAAFRNEVLGEFQTEAERSPHSRELLSAIWDIDGPSSKITVDKPAWYVPAQDRTEAVLQRLSKPFEVVSPQPDKEEARLMVNSPIEQAPKDELEKKTYLSVPFREKNEAKSLGAKWDRRQKSWYVNEGTDLKPFAKWQQKIDTNEEKIDPKQEFAAACQSEGLIIDEPMMDGKWHRVAVVGDAKGKTSGSYRGFIEGVPAGQIMNFKKASEPVKWVSTGSKVDPAEMERLKAQSAAKMAEQKQELQFKYKQVAKRAYGIFANAIDASNDHGYLKKKQVTGETLRVDQSGNLLVPMSNEKGFIENVQRIGPDGAKIYLKDGRKSGLMHIIPGKKNSPLIVAEGYATAKSLHAATGFSAVVAFDGGNLPVVAEALRKQNPDRQIVIAADDDHKQVEKIGLNPGLKAAERAAERSQAQTLKPVLSADEKLQGLTDHNDLHVARGFDHFRRDVRSQLAEMGITAGRGQLMKITPKKMKSQSNEMSV